MFDFGENMMFDFNGDGEINLFEQAVAYQGFLYITEDEEGHDFDNALDDFDDWE